MAALGIWSHLELAGKGFSKGVHHVRAVSGGVGEVTAHPVVVFGAFLPDEPPRDVLLHSAEPQVAFGPIGGRGHQQVAGEAGPFEFTVTGHPQQQSGFASPGAGHRYVGVAIPPITLGGIGSSTRPGPRGRCRRGREVDTGRNETLTTVAGNNSSVDKKVARPRGVSDPSPGGSAGRDAPRAAPPLW